MKAIKRGLIGLGTVSVLFFSLVFLVIGSGSVDSQTYSTSSGGISMSAKDFAQKFTEKTGRQLSEENAQTALDFGVRLMNQHHFTLQGTSGSLAVAYRECGFDYTAVNPSGGVAGFYLGGPVPLMAIAGAKLRKKS